MMTKENFLLTFKTSHETIKALQDHYLKSCESLRHEVKRFSQQPDSGGSSAEARSDGAPYPLLRCHIAQDSMKEIDARLSFGIVDQPGLYEATITDPFLFEKYLTEQLDLLIEHYQVSFSVGKSNQPIPLMFVLEHLPEALSQDQKDLKRLKHIFEQPNLQRIDDSTVNQTRPCSEQSPLPLSLFTAERIDYSLHRLKHYTGTEPKAFQNFILLTNYQRYIKEFIMYGLEQVKKNPEYKFTFSGGETLNHADLKESCVPHKRVDAHAHTQEMINQTMKEAMTQGPLVQMPAYHLEFPDHNGISIVNVGVGPSNAKTLTDHLAVLRPHCWLMLGHCAGLRKTQQLGDYVLAHGYVREDGVLDDDLPSWVPVPPVAEIQVALQDAVADVTGLQGQELKTRMRTGTVFTTSNRNWELRANELYERFNQSRAIAVDMESATIAANGLRFRVPYGTLLCVSDRPIHGDIKLPGMANYFYEQSISQHLKIGLKAIEIIRQRGINALHSRKLRGFNEPPFR